MNITIQRYLTPSGQDINKKGITPNVVVELKEEHVKAKDDVQLKKALEVFDEEEFRDYMGEQYKDIVLKGISKDAAVEFEQNINSSVAEQKKREQKEAAETMGVTHEAKQNNKKQNICHCTSFSNIKKFECIFINCIYIKKIFIGICSV